MITCKKLVKSFGSCMQDVTFVDVNLQVGDAALYLGLMSLCTLELSGMLLSPHVPALLKTPHGKKFISA